MKTNRLYTLLALLILLISSCSVDTIDVTNDDLVTYRTVNITDYDAVEIANAFEAYITFSDTEESIEIEANENLHNYIIAKKDNNKLVVRLKNNINVRGQETLKVHITTKSIKDFSVAADSKIILENALIEDNAKIKVSADSYFSGEVHVDYLEFRASADAKADLYGSVGLLNANMSADAKLSDYDLHVDDLKMKMSADCDANITVSNTIDIEAIADCTLSFKGNATVTHQKLTADSRIKKMD
jgi:transcriptional antiterminator Rof (Rho-off)